MASIFLSVTAKEMKKFFMKNFNFCAVCATVLKVVSRRCFITVFQCIAWNVTKKELDCFRVNGCLLNFVHDSSRMFVFFEYFNNIYGKTFLKGQRYSWHLFFEFSWRCIFYLGKKMWRILALVSNYISSAYSQLFCVLLWKMS